ncbi:hypothetical protein CRENBAI_006165 [Crenichthys baileyi]|uniref:Uncharacterized protein n=1 Tax=Crenichthys baileyi TaxID=28760 RepID=A0AAV9QMH2_9TELE
MEGVALLTGCAAKMMMFFDEDGRLAASQVKPGGKVAEVFMFLSQKILIGSSSNQTKTSSTDQNKDPDLLGSPAHIFDLSRSQPGSASQSGSQSGSQTSHGN